MKTIKTLTLMLLPMVVAASLQAQNASENFESYTVGDNLTTPLNGGTGWTGNWVTANATSASGIVSDSSPLATGANNYLAMDLANTSGGQAMGVGRELAGGAPTGDYAVSFLWRADDTSTFGGSSNDRFEFYSSSSAAGVNGAGLGGDTATSPYLMGIFGAGRGANYTTGGYFAVYDASSVGAGFTGDDYYDLGSVATGGDGTTLQLVQGTTYSFTIDVHVATQKWDVSVTDGATTAYSTGLNWWGSNTQPFIGFGSRGDQANEARQFSFDNVLVQAVPEPGSIALLSLGGMILPILSRRRRGNS